jgi:GMP synthase (glutamine-hydrolysing)
MKHDIIIILDFGSQVTQLIARRIRALNVYCEVHPCDVTGDWLLAQKTSGRLKGVILSGSHASVYEDGTQKISDIVFTLGVPVLGICYGMQIMAQQLGGAVHAGVTREFGAATIVMDQSSVLFEQCQSEAEFTAPANILVWMSHGDKVTQLPPGFTTIASNESCPIAAMMDKTRNFYGVQFHPEVTHTTQGMAIFKSFVGAICHARADWIMKDYVSEIVANIQDQVGSEEVILGLSGGVDSSVAAALIHRAIGDQLTCVFVDHGLLRQNEAESVMKMFVGKLQAKVVHVDANEIFLSHLSGVTDPEAKRKIIGREFVEIFKAEADKCKAQHENSNGATFLAQGTIYPDVIESGAAKGGKSITIKSHHNVGGLPADLGLKLLEPLRDLFKDEVRELGLALGLPYAMVYRHPFPGPGLGVRVLGEVKKEYCDLLRRADAIFMEELHATIDKETKKSWYELTDQAFAVFLPVRSVGVMGDGRTYEYVVALRAVQTTDFMTADCAELPMALLKRTSSRIINEVRGINRVTYDVSSKPPATIEWE